MPTTVLAALLAATLSLFATSARAAPIVEFYHAALDHYFVTGYAPEIQALDTGVHQGWQRTGYRFETFDAGDPRLAGSIPVCRFYGNPAHGLDSHFYSASPQECADVQARFPDKWLLESTDVFRVHPVSINGTCAAGTVPVYRLYNNRADANHRYTTDVGVVDQMVARGYLLEGVGSPRPVIFCAADLAPVGAAPACTLNANSTTPALGSPLVLTASCSNSPTAYEWLACAPTAPDACSPIPQCQAATTSCSPLGQVAGNVLYVVRASNSAGAGEKTGIVVSWTTSVSVPSCVIQPSTTTPAVNTTLTLVAACSNAPTSYQWTNCASTTSTCTTTSGIAGVRSYAVTASNAAGTSQAAGVSITWHNTPTGVPSCTLSANPSSPFAGTTTTITASCTQSPTSFSWTHCPGATGTTCVASSGVAGSVSYSLTAANAFGAGAPASIIVNWQAAPPPGADFCGEYPRVRRIDLRWGGLVNTNDPGGGLEDDMVLVGRLVVPPDATGTTIPGLISIVEFVDGPAPRIASLSTAACDFRGFTPGVFPTTDPTGQTFCA